MFKPAQVLNGQVKAVASARQQALDAHYARHPERYVNGPPIVRRPPAVVHINPDQAITATALLATVGSLRRTTPDDDAPTPAIVNQKTRRMSGKG